MEAAGYSADHGIGIPVMFLILNFSGIYIGSGRVIYPFYFNATGLIFNILLDPLLIFGMGPFPGNGCRGAATGHGTLAGSGIVAFCLSPETQKMDYWEAFRFLIRPANGSRTIS